jgi:hypothetical protein
MSLVRLELDMVSQQFRQGGTGNGRDDFLQAAIHNEDLGGDHQGYPSGDRPQFP